MKNFIWVYYKWGHDVKGTYAKMTMDKYFKKLVEGYKNHTGSEVKVQKTPGTPGTAVSKSYLE